MPITRGAPIVSSKSDLDSPAARPSAAAAELLTPAVTSESLAPAATAVVREIGGRKDGLEPTRYGDWEKNGRCIDF
jgi:hypothetical protein